LKRIEKQIKAMEEWDEKYGKDCNGNYRHPQNIYEAKQAYNNAHDAKIRDCGSAIEKQELENWKKAQAERWKKEREAKGKK